MNPPRERSAIVAAWIEGGPTELPESTRRAIAVDVRATRQSRKSRWARWRLPNVDRLTLLAMATAAAVVLALAGLAGSLIAPAGRYVGGAPTTPSASPAPSSAAPASAAPSSAAPTTLV